MSINLKLKKYWWLLLLILLILVLAWFFFKNPSILKTNSDNNSYTETSTAITLEYLSPEELNSLGADPSIKAQIISRDPLVYKIINNDADIIKDLKETPGFQE